MAFKSFTAEQRAEVVAAYATGDSAAVIASRYGCSHASVVQWVRDAGGKVRARPGYGDKSVAEETVRRKPEPVGLKPYPDPLKGYVPPPPCDTVGCSETWDGVWDGTAWVLFPPPQGVVVSLVEDEQPRWFCSARCASRHLIRRELAGAA